MTGGTSGFGLHTVRELQAAGRRMLVGARRPASGDQIALDLAELFRPARPSPDANSGGLKTPRRGNKMLSSGRHAADAQ